MRCCAIRRQYLSYIPTNEGWLYLAVVLDLFSRKVVGWAMRDHLRQELTIAVDLPRKSGEPFMKQEDFHGQTAETFYTGFSG